MTKRLASLAFAAVAVLSACNTATTKDLTPAELSGGLLTVADMGTAWRETQRDVFDVREAENPALDATQFCPDAAASLVGLDEVGSQSGADVEFQSKSGTSLVRLQAWSKADAPAYVDKIAAAVGDCDGAQWTDDNGVENVIDSVDGPDLGDVSVHWSATTIPNNTSKGDKLVSSGRTSVVQKGHLLMILQWGGAGADADAVKLDTALWAETVGNAFEKLDDL